MRVALRAALLRRASAARDVGLGARGGRFVGRRIDA